MENKPLSEEAATSNDQITSHAIRDEYSHFQGELESIYNKLITVRDSLDVPLFSIPPNQAVLDKIVARVTSK
ncbi:hypothetical protein TNCV_5000631 [Trichonephila clavipes]|nr:hypothetical protein TNCV_5000631 [Trichonephila clavipes]